MNIAIIAAIGRNRVLGKDNQLLWHMPADLQYFKSITMGKPIIMGRKTYESIGRALPGRRNIVVSHQSSLVIPDVEVVSSLLAAMDLLAEHEDAMVIGGASIYQQALPLAETLYLTQIDVEMEGDVYFPEWHSSDWDEISREDHQHDADNPFDYSFVTLKKR